MNLEKSSDKYLLYRMNNGDKEEAFRVIYNRYQVPLYNFCLSLCKNPHLAKEFSSDTFSKLFTNSDKYIPRSNASFKTWLYKIAKNHAIDYFRREASRRRNFPFMEDVKTKIPSRRFGSSNFSLDNLIYSLGFYEEEDYSISGENGAKERILDGIMNYLDHNGKEKYAEILKLRYFDDLSYKEIANSLDVPLGTMQARLFTAHRLLRKRLRSLGYDW